ncbi:MAG TPA: hypothetical protein PLC08_06340 [Candidatus Bipolaricaulis sp.]|nr:hypothetical protein [Candidatus Bipolaricaulis sp.]
MANHPVVSSTGYCLAWGSDWGARRVAGLTPEEKQAVRNGGLVFIHGCPPARTGSGELTTMRRVIYKSGQFYARVPERSPSEDGVVLCRWCRREPARAGSEFCDSGCEALACR